MAELPEPKTKSDARSFAGLANFYRKFCELFAVLMHSIYELTKDEVPDKDVTEWFTIPLDPSDPRSADCYGDSLRRPLPLGAQQFAPR